jgi:hypothetical protein
MRTIEDVLNRLRAEFLEMPGLRLKSEQVQRLCGVERMICQQGSTTRPRVAMRCVPAWPCR